MVYKARTCVACGQAHARKGRMCYTCEHSAALRTLRNRIVELERENLSLQRELAASREAQVAPRVAVERPRDVSLWWYHERDLLATGAATAVARAEANQIPVQTYLERIYGTPATVKGGELC